ncbi:BCL2/adenovirus E1B 19 kDa protein-interacting protein 3-like isoform X1 [Orbicella faveolata]|uniref:BCL2/adenovirus E1B 19 kDa protein-interacting protein 3-like isoform X1 n=1 Tax=Orbicella faveolata TaxID=48498 RepID=UPI0009E415D0|nr:BCL2/adenovirus E1B 19 kDa protein-interacting protein 3-like isoform X1 [Orbicella faveolata]
MANNVNGGSHSSIESLNGSWVKLDGSFRNGNGAQHSPVISEDGAMEDLLAEAVEEQSKQGSSGEKSPSSSPSPPGLLRTGDPILPQERNTDWIWEWSSRIESQPPKDWKMQHPTKKSKPRGSTLSIRRTKVMRSSSELMNINFYVVVPAVVLSHLIAFGIGVYVGRRMVQVDAL